MIDIDYLLTQCEVSEQLGSDTDDCPLTCRQLLPILRELKSLRRDNIELLHQLKNLQLSR